MVVQIVVIESNTAQKHGNYWLIIASLNWLTDVDGIYVGHPGDFSHLWEVPGASEDDTTWTPHQREHQRSLPGVADGGCHSACWGLRLLC